MKKSYVLLLDGGFVRIKLGKRNGRSPTVKDVVDFCFDLRKKPLLNKHDLLRILFYDAPPFMEQLVNPIDREKKDYSQSRQARDGMALIDGLEMQDNFAVRKGELRHKGWRLGQSAVNDIICTRRKTITPSDFTPILNQKGVDMRIGLDIAWMSIKKITDILVLVTGDSDFIPAMKMARREGILIYLETMGHGVYRDLKAHADIVF